MKTILYTYKFRIYPNNEQIIKLSRSFGCVRFTYNYFLNKEKEAYENDNIHLGYYSNAKELIKLKKEYIWLKECNSQSLQHSLKHLDNAYTKFFKEHKTNPNIGLPVFKSKKRHYDSFTIPQFCTIDDKHIYFPKFKEGIRCKFHSEVVGEIRNFTITKTPANKYYVSIQVEKEYEHLDKKDEAVGIDLGIENLLTLSNGRVISNNRYIDNYASKLAKAQKHLSRKKYGTHSYNRQRIKVAKIQEKITNSRHDYLHKITTNLIKQYGTICIEDLDNKEMITTDLKENEFRRERQSLNRNLTDVSFGTFKTLLSYKCEWNDYHLIKVNKYYPSSKTCHICGYKKIDLSLSDRTWLCPICNTVHNRDLNASINILNEGLRIKSSLSLGTNDYTDGAAYNSSFETRELTSFCLDETVMKSEATKSLA